MVRFCDNHGLLQVNNRPQWFTVQGGSKHYVQAITQHIDDKRLNAPVQGIQRDEDGVRLLTAQGVEAFDEVIIATHADQALRLLSQPSAPEQEVLSQIRFQANRAVLHTDTSVMPNKRLAWAAWNYERSAAHTENAHVCLHYWLNKLQPLPFNQDVFVSLNPITTIDEQQVLGEFEYDHPVFDLNAIQAQRQLAPLQGQQHTWFAGAWMGYGFHEDGFKAGKAAANGVLTLIHQEAVV